MVACLAPVGATGCGSSHAAAELPRSFCSEIVRGKDSPRFLVVTDLPLRGNFRETTVAMAAAARYVVENRGFRAGKYAVGFQSCDDSTADAQNFTIERCTANAKAYAANEDVIGMVGTFNSDCARALVPVVDVTKGGPLAVVSPAATDPALTHVYPGANPGEPKSFYPSGVRNFVRVAPPDDVEWAADAILIRSLGGRRVFVLTDREPYGSNAAGGFRQVARSLGLVVAGTAFWDEHAHSYAALAARVAAQHPEAVYVSALWQLNGPAVVAAIRIALPDTPVVANQGFASLPPQRDTSLDGVYVTTPGLEPVDFPPKGRAIINRFGPGQFPGFGPAYAAQAMDVLLDAIARSDGSRGDVVKQLAATSVKNGYIGSFRFDANGDPTANPITVLRIEKGRLRRNRVIQASVAGR